MTRTDVTRHFETLGLWPEDAERRAVLLDHVAARFVAHVGAPPEARWFVPGRIEVFGKHTDYAGGRSLLAAAPRGFALVMRPRADAVVRVVDARDQQVATVQLDGRGPAPRGWANYVSVVARRLAANFPGAPLGADIAIGSNLPRAAGMSSSSALVVGVASALVHRGRLTERDEWRQALRTPEEVAWYLGCVENGLDFAGLPGADGVGTHGGSEDHTAILTCKAGRLSEYGFVPVRHHGDVALPEDWRFVIVSSGVHADKAGSVKDRYNHASLATRALLALWNRGTGNAARSLGDALESQPGAADTLRRLAAAGHDAFDGPTLARRLAHFVAENGRVPLAHAAVARRDAAALGALAAASQQDADLLLGNQVTETRALAGCAADCGIWAASSFGAGFGGSVWGLAFAHEANEAARAWRAAYARLHPEAVNVECFVARPGPGVVELPA